MASELRQTNGTRQSSQALHATGAAPETAAVISFKDDGGNALTTINTASARHLVLKCLNADAADAITISYRIKCHPDDADFVEVATHTGTNNTTTFDTLDETVLGYQMQIWWSNATGAGAADSEVSAILKG